MSIRPVAPSASAVIHAIGNTFFLSVAILIGVAQHLAGADAPLDRTAAKDQFLTNYQCPEWFRDAKFGVWAHWGAQGQPERGDRYARNLYIQGSTRYKSHLVEYGHPSTNGFKDVFRDWRAEHFDPEELLGSPGPLKYTRDDSGLHLELPAHKPCNIADTFEIFL